MNSTQYLQFWIAQVKARSPYYAESNARFLDAAIKRYDAEHGTNLGELA